MSAVDVTFVFALAFLFGFEAFHLAIKPGASTNDEKGLARGVLDSIEAMDPTRSNELPPSARINNDRRTRRLVRALVTSALIGIAVASLTGVLMHDRTPPAVAGSHR